MRTSGEHMFPAAWDAQKGGSRVRLQSEAGSRHGELNEGCKRRQKGPAEHAQGFKWATPHTR